MSSIANVKKRLERISKSVCSAADMIRQWPNVRAVQEEQANLPYVLSSTGQPETLAMFADPATPVTAPLRWAVCRGGIRVAPAADNQWVGIVRGVRCDDHLGANREVREIVFLLRGKSGQQYSLSDGETFAYLIDANNNRFIIMDPLDETGAAATGDDATYYLNDVLVGQQPELDLVEGTGITITATEDAPNNIVRYTFNASGSAAQPPLYAKAQNQWSKSGYVNVKLLTGLPGSSETGSTIQAYFTNNSVPSTPTSQHTPPMIAPNVRKGQDILVAYDNTDRLVVIDPNAYQEGIGRVTLLMNDGDYQNYHRISAGGSFSVGNAASGTYTLTFQGQTTSSLQWNDNAATIQSALEGLSTIGSGNITITGTDPFDWVFGGSMSEYQPPLIFTNQSLLDGSAGPASGAGADAINLSGWGFQDGIENSAANGGSGRDWTTNDGSPSISDPPQHPPIYPYFVPAATTNALSSSASEAHSHVTETEDNTTGITLPSHDPHVHRVGTSCTDDPQNIDFGTDTPAYLIVSLTDVHEGGQWYTGREKVYSASSHSDDHDDTSLTHSVTDPGHSHPVNMDGTYQKVHYKGIIALERLDNSTEKLGV